MVCRDTSLERINPFVITNDDEIFFWDMSGLVGNYLSNEGSLLCGCETKPAGQTLFYGCIAGRTWKDKGNCRKQFLSIEFLDYFSARKIA